MGIENRSTSDSDGIRGKIRRVDSVRFQRSLSSFVLPQTQRPGMMSSHATLKYAKLPSQKPAGRADFATAAARQARIVERLAGSTAPKEHCTAAERKGKAPSKRSKF